MTDENFNHNQPLAELEVSIMATGIFAAVCRVQKKLAERGIAKDQKNTSQGWKFRGIDDLLNTLGGILAEEKVLIMPDILKATKEIVPTGKGKSMTHWFVKVNYTMFNEAGQNLTRKAVGEAFDMSDKGLAKAMTNAYKYFIFQAFCVPLLGQEFGDPDSDYHEMGGWESKPDTSQGQTPDTKSIDKTQVKVLQNLIKATKADTDIFCKYFKIEKIADMDAEIFQKALTMLQVKKSDLEKQSEDAA